LYKGLWQANDTRGAKEGEGGRRKGDVEDQGKNITVQEHQFKKERKETHDWKER